MKLVFVRYSVHEYMNKTANGYITREIHLSDIIDIEKDKIDDLEYIKDRLSKMYGFITEQIEIKYVRTWQ